MKKLLLGRMLAVVAACVSQPVMAQSAGDWTFGIGAHQVAPKSDNGHVLGGAAELDIGNDAKPTVTLEYFVSDNLGIELLAAAPFEHDVDIVGLGTVASAKQLPPTVSLQYHFNSAGRVSPLISAGVNYTLFFSEETKGALAGSRLKLEDSWGLAARVGLDFKVGQSGAIRIDARWMDIDSDVELDGTEIGTAQIDPLAYGAAYVIKF